MAFFFLILVNIFMWALFYLVVSLKLEKSASEFREKRLRKEMDEIIREFNAAAERNITLLENKIEQYKRLAGRNGDYAQIDLIVGEETVKISKEAPTKYSYEEKPADDDMTENDQPIHYNKSDAVSELFNHTKEKLNSLKDLIFSNIRYPEKKPKSSGRVDIISSSAGSEISDDKTTGSFKSDFAADSELESPIKKSFKDILPELTREPLETASEMQADIPDEEYIPDAAISEDEIMKIIREAPDKRSIVTDLHSRGLDFSAIAEYTGIPHGEVTLIVNLSAGR